MAVPVEFVLFGATLLCVALFHRHAMHLALAGLALIVGWKLFSTGFPGHSSLAGLAAHLGSEWVTLANLLGLLTGFALLARHFEDSHLPLLLPALLPDDWRGGFALLAIIFVMSAFLDNIAAAMIGGTLATVLFRGRVHVGFVAAIVAAANAGGAGSVVGDTTTTMMWIQGVAPSQVLHAYVGALVALLVFGVPAALQQQAYSPIICDSPPQPRIDWARVIIVALTLVASATVNIIVNERYPQIAARLPFLGLTVWIVLLLTAAWRRPAWQLLPTALKGSVFLLSLVLCASLMPVEQLPPASWPTTLALGALSAVFDNIPLTELALKAGGYDWGFLAYSVGFGGSMIWFGSSAGVALAGRFPAAQSVSAWLRAAWYVPIAYLAGFVALLLVVGWQPHSPLH